MRWLYKCVKIAVSATQVTVSAVEVCGQRMVDMLRPKAKAWGQGQRPRHHPTICLWWSYIMGLCWGVWAWGGGVGELSTNVAKSAD